MWQVSIKHEQREVFFTKTAATTAKKAKANALWRMAQMKHKYGEPIAVWIDRHAHLYTYDVWPE